MRSRETFLSAYDEINSRYSPARRPEQELFENSVALEEFPSPTSRLFPTRDYVAWGDDGAAASEEPYGTFGETDCRQRFTFADYNPA